MTVTDDKWQLRVMQKTSEQLLLSSGRHLKRDIYLYEELHQQSGFLRNTVMKSSLRLHVVKKKKKKHISSFNSIVVKKLYQKLQWKWWTMQTSGQTIAMKCDAWRHVTYSTTVLHCPLVEHNSTAWEGQQHLTDCFRKPTVWDIILKFDLWDLWL